MLVHRSPLKIASLILLQDACLLSGPASAICGSEGRCKQNLPVQGVAFLKPVAVCPCADEGAAAAASLVCTTDAALWDSDGEDAFDPSFSFGGAGQRTGSASISDPWSTLATHHMDAWASDVAPYIHVASRIAA
eukprot:scaffold256592_cov29-Prasinocladus_malaysianus.AAC.1